MREQLPIPQNLDGIVWHFVAGLGEPHRPAHTHKELEVNLCVRGRATYLCQSRHYRLSRSAVLWFFPSDVHELIEWSADFEMWVVVFRPAVVRETALQTGDSRLTKTHAPEGGLRLLPEETTAFLTSLAQNLQRDALAAGLRFFLARAWAAFVTEGQSSLARVVHPAVECAVLALAEGTDDPDSEAFAHRCGLSRARLSHQFKLDMGIALVTYRNRKRLERFYRIFGDGRKKTVLDAALEAGFGSAAQFYRVRRQFSTNLSP